MSSLYETDYDRWLQTQFTNLRAKNWADLDVENLIDDLEHVNKSDARELRSYLVVLILHLLKYRYQPEKQTDSWIDSIENSREQIQELFQDRPSLKPQLAEAVHHSYPKARKKASKETKLNYTWFPSECPYSLEEILDPKFLPKPII